MTAHFKSESFYLKIKAHCSELPANALKYAETEFEQVLCEILFPCENRTLFTGTWATSAKQMYTVPGVSPEMMQIIINYAYTHTVPLTEDNMVHILAAADQFLVSGMIQACCFFLEDRLCLMNCIGIWRLVDFYHFPELREKAFFYILQHFEEIIYGSEELLELSEEQLAAFLDSDHLNVKCEDAAFEAILRWINYLPDQRRESLPALLAKVRLSLMTSGYLQNSVMNNAMIKSSIKCMSIVKSAYSSPLSRPRLPSSILVVTGGKNGTAAGSNCEAYDSRTDSWVTVACDLYRAHHRAVVLDGCVCLIGGCNHQTRLNTVQKLDLISSTCQHVAPMNSARCYVSAVVLNGCIYAMGGFSGQNCLNTVECYNPEADRWTTVAQMHAKRCGAGAAALHGKAYICGGFNGYGCLSTAECYNPDTNQWTTIAAMRCRRSGLGVIAYKNWIFAVGGIVKGINCLCSAEVYNPVTNTWSSLPSMRHRRSYFGIEVLDDQIFVVGGYDGYRTISSVDASDAEMSRSGLSCCVGFTAWQRICSLVQIKHLEEPEEFA
uniref:Kelch like family member 10 n=1 Tax=Amphilophus citrinellus TaxID=61819 RepID=A0A3Q0S702_AMPCI